MEYAAITLNNITEMDRVNLRATLDFYLAYGIGGDPTPLARELPRTGADTGQVVGWGIGSLLAGAVLLGGAFMCRRKFPTYATTKENQ